MQFTLKTELSDDKIEINERRLSTMLRTKALESGTRQQRRHIPVLITDKMALAKAHDEEKDAITILMINGSERVSGGIIASYPADVEHNLLEALKRVHPHGHSTGIAERA